MSHRPQDGGSGDGTRGGRPGSAAPDPRGESFELEGTLASQSGLPPPAADLLAAIGDMRPVATRRPARTVALLGLAVAVAVVVCLLLRPLRHDLPALPAGWVAAVALAWLAALTTTLLATARPRRGEVLPDTARAGRTAVAAAVGLVLLGLTATVDAPGHTVVPAATLASFADRWWHCTSVSLIIALPLLLAGALLLRGLFPMGENRIGAALGALGGVTAGLVLHLTCPIGGGLHVGLSHAGGVALGAALGWLLLPRLLRA